MKEWFIYHMVKRTLRGWGGEESPFLGSPVALVYTELCVCFYCMEERVDRALVLKS